jgi:hypothetical protein
MWFSLAANQGVTGKPDVVPQTHLTVMIVIMADLQGRPLLGTQADRHLFVDRSAELREARQCLEARINILILGRRGSGRTSFLHQLESRMNSAGWRTVFVEGTLARTPLEFISLLQYRLAPRREHLPASTEDFAALAEAIRSWNLTRTVRPEGLPGESEELLDRLRTLRDSLGSPEKPVVVLVDEIPSPEVGHTLFGRLRDELWQLPVVWAVAGDVSAKATYLRPPADAFFPRSLALGPLDDDAAFEFLRKRLTRREASDLAIRDIVKASDRYPRSLVSRAADSILLGKDPKKAAQRAIAHERTLADLGESAQRLVAELEARGPASASDPSLLEHLGWSRSRAAQVFGTLERAGLVHGTSERREGSRPRKVYELVQL